MKIPLSKRHFAFDAFWPDSDFSNRVFYSLPISTVCFKSGTALATCSKKKRKRDILEAMEEMEEALLKENKISPSLSGNEDVVEEEHNLRDPRLFTTFNY